MGGRGQRPGCARQIPRLANRCDGRPPRSVAATPLARTGADRMRRPRGASPAARGSRRASCRSIGRASSSARSRRLSRPCWRRFVQRPPVGTGDGAGIRSAVLDARPERPDRSCHAPGAWVMLAPHCCAAENAGSEPRRRLVARRHERSICANLGSGRNDRPIAGGRPGGVALGRFPGRASGARREFASSTLKGEPSWRRQVISTRRGSDVGS